MAAGQGGNPNQDSSGLGILWFIGSLFVIFGLIWLKFKDQIIGTYVFIKKMELLFLDVLSYLPLTSFNDNVNQMLDFILLNPDTQDLDALLYIGQQTGFYLSFVMLLLSATSLRLVWNKNTQVRCVTKHNMNTLSTQEEKNWVKIMPVINLNLIDIDINTGPWSMALTPLQFCKKNELVSVETVIDRKSPWKTEGVKKANLIKEKAEIVFKKQMGKLWEGEFSLPDYARALFAIFLARIEHDVQGSAELLEDLSVSYSKGVPDFSLVEPLLKKHRQSKAAIKCVQSHAYVLTVMAAMLKLARTDGVLATADFIWLKPIDRELWYMLNCVGRQTPYCEVAGPYAHLIAELELGRPLFRPVINQAIIALEQALEKIIYLDDETKASN
ncbi:phosphoesterase [bacterium]|nr:phosphoesterase [bacterium]NBX71942.1 phosphoesterase [bacterium]